MLLRRVRVSGCLWAAIVVPHRFFLLVHGGGALPADSLPVFPTLPGGDNDLRDCPQVSRLNEPTVNSAPVPSSRTSGTVRRSLA